jgi:hypothetical protein
MPVLAQALGTGWPADVTFGSISDMRNCPGDVCFAPPADIGCAGFMGTSVDDEANLRLIRTIARSRFRQKARNWTTPNGTRRDF